MLESRPDVPVVPPPERVTRRAWVRPAGLLALFVAVLAAAWIFDLTERLSAERIRSTLRGYGYWAPAAILAAYVVRPLALLPITPLWVTSGAFFGWLEGAALSVAGTSLGAAVGFGLARRLGRGFVQRRLGPRAARWGTLDRGQGMRTVLALQLTPIVPHDLINALAGVSPMAYRSFFLGSLLGTIPIILIYSYLGYAILEPGSPPFWIALSILTTMTIFMLAWNRRAARRRTAAPIPDPREGGAG